MINLEKLVLIATIGTIHGLNGGVYINAYSRNPTELNRYGTLYSDDGREFKILNIYKKNKRFVVLFDGINNRSDAEGLRNLNLYVKRKDLNDEELEDDEFFNTDLEGMEIFDLQGKYWGTICGIYDFGAGSIIELYEGSVNKKFMIPFTKETVLNVNMKEKKILIDHIAAGLNSSQINKKKDIKPNTDRNML